MRAWIIAIFVAAIAALGEPDAFPSSDLGLLHATALENHRQLDQRAETWRPWRAYAAMYLWKFGSQGVGGPTQKTLSDNSARLPHPVALAT